jgi:serine/threonine protein kinase/uncharacterized protein YodC (DUF2158 family)
VKRRQQHSPSHSGPASNPNRYQLHHPLGDPGGEGSVWKAVDRACIPPLTVALKVHHEFGFGRRHDNERLLEIMTDLSVRLRNVRHAGIVPLHEPYIDSASGRVCVPMPFVEGLSFTKWTMAEDDMDRRVKMLTASGEAVDELHRAGLVHGDIKPVNIIVEIDRERSVLVDYGLTRIAGDGGILRTVAGTPGYRPPEVFSGVEITPSSDLYMFAATVLFSITREDPPRTAHDLQPWARNVLARKPISSSARRCLVEAVSPEPRRRPATSIGDLIQVALDGHRSFTSSRGTSTPSSSLAEPQETEPTEAASVVPSPPAGEPLARPQAKDSEKPRPASPNDGAKRGGSAKRSPAWYRDPTRRYAARLWDGKSWSDRVYAADGVVTTDRLNTADQRYAPPKGRPLGALRAGGPKKPATKPASGARAPVRKVRPLGSPAWYRDPTGRYVGRWWDGGNWSDAVFAEDNLRDSDGVGLGSVRATPKGQPLAAPRAGGTKTPPTKPAAKPTAAGSPAAVRKVRPLKSPAWYRDPTGRYIGRWWDGGNWSDAVFAEDNFRDSDAVGIGSLRATPKGQPLAAPRVGGFKRPATEPAYGGSRADVGKKSHSERPAWYQDPTGRYAGRWWDGNNWSDAVFAGDNFRDSDAVGIGSLSATPAGDPLAGPGWYPDPTGRYGVRWWGGTQWTDAVFDIPNDQRTDSLRSNSPAPTGSTIRFADLG